MASVRDIKIAEALLILCLAYYVMAEWIAEMLFMLFFACNRQKIAEYEAYWHRYYIKGALRPYTIYGTGLWVFQ